MGLPSKVSKLEKKVNKISKIQKGDNPMINMLKELIGKECVISFNSSLISGDKYKVLDVDDEWIKISSVNKKGVERIELVRIDDIDKIEINTI